MLVSIGIGSGISGICGRLHFFPVTNSSLTPQKQKSERICESRSGGGGRKSRESGWK